MDLLWISPEVANDLGMVIGIMKTYGSWGFGTWVAFHLFSRFSETLPEEVIQLYYWTLGFVLCIAIVLLFRMLFPRPELPQKFQSSLFADDFFSVWSVVASGSVMGILLLITWIVMMVIGLRFGLQRFSNLMTFKTTI